MRPDSWRSLDTIEDVSTEPIIVIPHPTLRQKAEAILAWSPELETLVKTLIETLQAARNPRGVGLAAPQIDHSLRMFATLLNDEPRIFINPHITKSSEKLTLGRDPDDPDLEGCLSIPRLYAPVPRHSWVELTYQQPENGKLIEHKETFDDFPARVVQHEQDHLDGILFLDHTLRFDLPVLEGEGREKLKPVSRAMVETLVHQSWNA